MNKFSGDTCSFLYLFSSCCFVKTGELDGQINDLTDLFIGIIIRFKREVIGAEKEQLELIGQPGVVG